MSTESLEKLGLFFDELKRIRVWEPEAAQRTTDLKDQSKDFVSKIKEFHSISSDFLSLIQDLGKQVEQEKIRTLGSSNVLKSMAKERECQQQQYQTGIITWTLPNSAKWRNKRHHLKSYLSEFKWRQHQMEENRDCFESVLNNISAHFTPKSD